MKWWSSKIALKVIPSCTILHNWVFENFILADERFAKALHSLETSVLVNNNFCEKSVPSLELPRTSS